MLIALNPSRTDLTLTPESISELKFLGEFVGGKHVPAGQITFLSPEPRIAKTVLSRLKEEVDGAFALKITPDVKSIMEWKPFLDPLPDWFRYYTEPLEHQDIALRYLWTFRRYGLGLDPGLGKTKVVLDWIWLLMQANARAGVPNEKFLVVCPRPLLSVWKKQGKIHRPELVTHVLQSVTYSQRFRERKLKLEDMSPDTPEYRQKTAQIRREMSAIDVERRLEIDGIRKADVVVTNYAKVVQNTGFFLSQKWLGLAVDEALVKNPDSEQTDALTRICEKVDNFTLMSGTLINNHAGDVFSPVRMMHRDLLGTSFYKFKKRYAIETDMKVGREEEEQRTIKRIVGYRREHLIKAALDSVFLFMRKEQWLKDLPPKVFKEVHVRMSDAQKAAYRELKANYSLSLGNGAVVEVDNALSCTAKLTQISSGFLYYGQSDSDLLDLGLSTLGSVLKKKGKDKKKRKPTGPRETWLFPEQPKLDAARSLLQGVLAREKVVLWYNYGAEGDLLSEMMREIGVSFRVINGNTKNSGEDIDAFNDSSSIQVLLCQAKAVNYGVTLLGNDLENCEYEPDLNPEVCNHIFYSLNYSLEVFLQQQDRSHRIGMKKSPTYYILMADSPMEHAIARKLLMKQEVREAFLEDTLRPKRLSKVEGIGD